MWEWTILESAVLLVMLDTGALAVWFARLLWRVTRYVAMALLTASSRRS